MGIQQALLGNRGIGYQPISGGVTNNGGDAYVTFGSNGVISYVGASTVTANWYLPTTAGIGVDKWIRFTKASGDAVSGSDYVLADGTWNDLSVDRNFGYLIAQGIGRASTYTVDIATDSGGSTIVCTGSITFDN